MKEYEYSFEVKNLKPYIDYCTANGYALKSSGSQKRVLFRNKNKTLARITYNKINDKITINSTPLCQLYKRHTYQKGEN